MTNTIEKPKAQVLGQHGNVFNLIGICSKALKKANQPEQAKEMAAKCFASGSYHEALTIMANYCELY